MTMSESHHERENSIYNDTGLDHGIGFLDA